MQTTLTRAELEAHDPEGGRGGRWLCPLPSPECVVKTDPRKHRSLHLESNGVWNCHRCKAGGQLKDHWKPREFKSFRQKQAEDRQRRDAETSRKLEEIGRRFRGAGKPLSAASLALLGPSYQAVGAAPVPATAIAGTPATLPSIGRAGKSGVILHPEFKTEDLFRTGTTQEATTGQALAFLVSRGFTEAHAKLLTRARVRYAPDFGRRKATQEKRAWSGVPAIVFPIRDEMGQLCAFQGRLLENLPGGGTNKLTFGPKTNGVFWGPGSREAWQEGAPIAICEAPFDALTLALCDVPAVALCGSSHLPAFLKRGCFGRRYWLAFDADKAGDDAAAVTGSELRSLGALVERLRPTEAKDWNEALQTGGAVWDRTAAALLPLLGSEAKASTDTGERSEAPKLAEVGRELEQVGAPALPELERVGKEPHLELKEVETESPSGIEQNGTEKRSAETVHFVPFQTGIGSGDLYGDRRQEVLSWALSEARRGTLPEPSEALALPSGQRIAAGGAAVWLQEAQKRAEALSRMGAVSVDAERAFLVVRQDMRALSILAADASRELLLLAELETLAAELEGDLPEMESASL